MVLTKKLLYKVVQKIGDINGGMGNIWDSIYPVGSYYETSDTSFKPTKKFNKIIKDYIVVFFIT